jgi:hypothetical protein
MSFQHDVGAYLVGKAGITPAAQTAGATAEIDGLEFDRLGKHSMKVCIEWSATLAEGKTLSLAGTVQDTATSGSGHADFIATALATTVVATGGTGGTTETGCTSFDVDFDAGDSDDTCKRYVRVQITPTCSATQTDTLMIGCVCVLGGADVLPAS